MHLFVIIAITVFVILFLIFLFSPSKTTCCEKKKKHHRCHPVCPTVVCPIIQPICPIQPMVLDKYETRLAKYNLDMEKKFMADISKPQHRLYYKHTTPISGITNVRRGMSSLGILQDAVDAAKADKQVTNGFNKFCKSEYSTVAESVNLLNSFYQGFEDNWTEADLINMFDQVGIMALDVALALCDLGWMVGPLATFWGGSKAVPPPLNAQIISVIIDSALNNQALTDLLNNQTAAFAAVKSYFTQYNTQQFNIGVLCPLNSPCPANTAGKCDPSWFNDQGIACMINPGAQSSGLVYDPSIITAGHRTVLNPVLTDIDNPVWQMLFNSPFNIQQMSVSCGIGTGADVAFCPSFLLIIQYTIAYYHELAKVDLSVDEDGNFWNPWISNNIGGIEHVWNSTTGMIPATPQGSGQGLLGALQTICIQYESWIVNALKNYWHQLVFQTGICDEPHCKDPGPDGGRLPIWWWQIFDKTGSGAVEVISSNWYTLMQGKYGLGSYTRAPTQNVYNYCFQYHL